MPNHDPVLDLTRRLNYTFNDTLLLEEALTHRSMGAHNNERLEFLGDSVLNFVIAEVLYKNCPELREGDLSRLRASLVNGESLADIARELELGNYLRLGSGELRSGGFRRSSILADAVEGILGAVYCDTGFESCRELILRLYENKLNNLPQIDTLKDPKTRLQELLQSRQYALPVYDVKEIKGKAHNQVFYVECRINELDYVARAKGGSRRKAEQAAAKIAFDQLKEKLNV